MDWLLVEVLEQDGPDGAGGGFVVGEAETEAAAIEMGEVHAAALKNPEHPRYGKVLELTVVHRQAISGSHEIPDGERVH